MKKIILFALITFTGCTPVLMMMYGIKNPKVENEKSITKKALKFGLDTGNIVSVCSADYRKTLKEADGLPNAAIFDSKGNYIEYRISDTSCNAGLFEFIPELSPTKIYNKTGKTTLLIEQNKFRTLKGAEIPYALENGTDFYLLIYWAVFTGKLNKDHVKVWEGLAKKNTLSKIKIIKVNMDFQEHWDKAEREKIIEAMSKKK